MSTERSWEVQIGDEIRLVRVEPVQGGQDYYKVRVDDGPVHTVDTRHLKNGVLHLLVEEISTDCGVDPTEEGFDVDVRGARFEATVTDPRRKALRMADTAGGGVVRTAMPGRIIRRLVAEGDTVIKGQPLLVVEAMKMENEIKSPRDGVLRRFAVAEGELVESKAVLAELE